VRVALYARVSTDVQEARGSIGSQLQTLREWAVREAHDLVAEYVDDGCSGARLDRPGLDSLRDSAERGLFEAILCLTPDRLARSYPYQFLVLEELARHGVRVLFFDAPDLDDDPQVRLLTEMQGVIAECERAKIAERNRRGRLFRARSGEVVHHKVPYGYRRAVVARLRPTWRCSSQRQSWCGGSLTTTLGVAIRCARSPGACTRLPSAHRLVFRPGGIAALRRSCTTQRMWVRCTATALRS
jgi:DNA invertase Pin-like site-specific DNA recombinase